MIDYGKLSEQYAGFLVAIGGVSITVLTLVLSIWPLQRQYDKDIPVATEQNDSVEENNRPALIFSLIIATFCCFVGAHLMAETAAFLAGMGSKAGSGAKQFLLAGVNIFVGVTVVMFALMLLATEYKRENQSIRGIRRMSLIVFVAVVICVLWWMGISVLSRMPAPDTVGALLLPMGFIAIFPGLPYLLLWIKSKNTLYRYMLPFTFILIIGFTVSSLIFFSCSLLEQNGGTIRNWNVGFFVYAITFTCVSLALSGYVIVKTKGSLPLWPQKANGLSREVGKQLHNSESS